MLRSRLGPLKYFIILLVTCRQRRYDTRSFCWALPLSSDTLHRHTVRVVLFNHVPNRGTNMSLPGWSQQGGAPVKLGGALYGGVCRSVLTIIRLLNVTERERVVITHGSHTWCVRHDKLLKQVICEQRSVLSDNSPFIRGLTPGHIWTVTVLLVRFTVKIDKLPCYILTS